MNGLCGTYSSPDGSLEISESGGFLRFFYRGRLRGAPMRLVCYCGGRAVPVGIPVPSGGELLLDKRISRASASSMGLRSMDDFALIPLDSSVASAKSEGHASPSPLPMIDDPAVRDALCGVKGLIVRKTDGGSEIAVPVSDTEPFPLMPVFCFGRSEEINSREYIVFTVKNGKLY